MKLEYASPESVNINSAGLSKIEELTQKALDDKITAGLNMIVARHGKIVYHKSFGKLNLSENSPPAPFDALYSVRSVSKPITAVIIMTLYEQGLLDINDPVQKYIPEFQGDGKAAVKIHHLLTHTTGMCDDDISKYFDENKSNYSIPDVVPSYLSAIKSRKNHLKWWLIALQAPLTKPTGKEMSYCNTGYNLLGFIVKIVTGKSINIYAREHLFKPLGMNDTSYIKSAKQIEGRVIERIPRDGQKISWMCSLGCFNRMSGCCSVSTTAYDLAIFGQMLLNKGEYDGKQILSERSVELLTTNQIPGIPAILGDFSWNEASWGYGFNTQGVQCNFPTNKAYSHGGFAGSFVLIDPILDIVIVTLKALNGDFTADFGGLNEAVVDACIDYEGLKTMPIN
jgi:CubicO group peptidase (beta-lactamase class C family)